MSIFFKKSANKLSRYQDPTGEFGNSELKKAFWFAKYRIQLRKAFIGCLIFWCVVTVGTSLVLWGKYFAYDLWRDNANLASQSQEFVNFAAIQEQYRARPIQFGQSLIFQSNTNRYDFVTPVNNPNERFIARVFYHYEYAGGKTPQQTLLLLPLIQTPMVVLGHETQSGFPSRATLVVDEIRWKRVNAHAIPDIQEYMTSRLLFPVSDVGFEPQNTAEGLLSSQVSFTISNDSVYHYWDVPLHVELLRSGQLVGVLSTSLTQFRAGDVRRIELFTTATLPFVDDVRVSPIINIFDPASYIDVGS